MDDSIDRRAEALAVYITETGATVRAAAARFGVSKSTVHKDLTERLRQRNRSQYLQTRAVLDRNKAERHLRGGEATRQKYKMMRTS
ncbi:MAG: sporulation transcriptional regulator SpoIIID [Oscillospiraceae bacterium]|nr:sporulation transcriptional regulator SpoIIID [Oscillospiraceae bacterium]